MNGSQTGRDAQGGYATSVNGAGEGGGGGYNGPGSIATPGNMPDYGNLIANDPVFLQLQKDLAAGGASDLAGRNAAWNRLLVQFGGQMPDISGAAKQLGLTDFDSSIDPGTAQLAAENPYSTTSRLNQAHTDAVRQIRQALAARGGLQSGEFGYQLGKENTAFGQANNDATQALLDAIGQIQSGYAQSERQRQAEKNAGLSSATDRQIGLNPATGTQTATYDPATGLYKDPNGLYYTADGQPARPGTTGELGPRPAPFNPAVPAAAASYVGGTGTIGPRATPFGSQVLNRGIQAFTG